MMLSCAHVLAPAGVAKRGDAICQQSREDNPTRDCENSGSLQRWLDGNFTIQGKRFGVDAAVASVATTLRTVQMRNILGIGAIANQPAPAQLGAAIRKRGRTSGLTQGVIVAIDTDFEVDGVKMYNQIEANGVGAQPFTVGGDSGSVYVTGPAVAPARSIALHWLGGGQRSIGSPMSAVLRALAVEL
jgi:hypothetical protein